MEWIKVTDKLPELCEPVLVIYQDSQIDIMEYSHDRGHWLGGKFGAYYETQITHWMHLPNQPKGA